MLAILPKFSSPTGHVMLGASLHCVEREVSATQTTLSSLVGTYAHNLGEVRTGRLIGAVSVFPSSSALQRQDHTIITGTKQNWQPSVPPKLLCLQLSKKAISSKASNPGRGRDCHLTILSPGHAHPASLGQKDHHFTSFILIVPSSSLLLHLFFSMKPSGCCNLHPSPLSFSQEHIFWHLENLSIKSYGISLVVQLQRLCTLNAGGPGSIPDQGTRFHMLQLRPRAAKYINIF